MSPTHVAYYTDRDTRRRALFEGDEMACVQTAFSLNEIELAHLAQGGTLWVTTWRNRWRSQPCEVASVQPPAERSDR